MSIVATALLPFASSPDTYWRFVFPAFVIGSSGMQLVYTHVKYDLSPFPVVGSNSNAPF